MICMMHFKAFEFFKSASVLNFEIFEIDEDIISFQL
jgi:hypothetical protein